MSQTDIDAALDALEISETEVVDQPIVEDEPIIENEIIEEEIKEEPKANPPGFIDNMDDWVAAGKDPDLFKGKKAYEQEYDRIQEIKGLKDTMQTVVEGFSDWKTQQQQEMDKQVDQARNQAQADLEKARDDVDVDAALEAQKKLDGLEAKPEAQKQHPVISDFYNKNPILDKTNAQYDEDVWRDASMFQASLINELTGGNQSVQLTESQIARSMQVALNKAKTMNPDKFVSPRNNRKAAPTATRRETQGPTDYGAKMKSVKIVGKNKRDVDGANDVYQMILTRAGDPAKNKAAADKFAKSFLGE
jgi:hypothetical protein